MGMAVDIDIGGTGLGRMEDDEVTPVDDYEEVEAVEVMGEEPLPPQKAPPSGVKKSNPWVKRIMVLAVVIILIIAGLFAFVFFNTRITDIKVSFSVDDTNFPDSILVSALAGTTGSASVAGSGKLNVIYKNNEVYSTDIEFNDEGTAVHELDYNKFIEGNGNYDFEVEYRGIKGGPETYNVNYIVERINISAQVGHVGGTPKINLTCYMQAESGLSLSGIPKGHELTIVYIKRLDDGSTIEEDYEPTAAETHDSHFEMQFDYQKSGNYTFSATVINTRAKPDSDYHEITEVRDKVRLNQLPIPRVTHTITETLLTYTVTFDASLSWNDGAKSLYKWDFNNDGDIDEETTSATAQYEYSKGINPDILVNVVGDVWVWDPFDLEYDIEMGSAFVHVNSP
jgi:hypothetical protein